MGKDYEDPRQSSCVKRELEAKYLRTQKRESWGH